MTKIGSRRRGGGTFGCKILDNFQLAASDRKKEREDNNTVKNVGVCMGKRNEYAYNFFYDSNLYCNFITVEQAKTDDV